MRIDAVVRLGIDKIAVGDSGKLIGILSAELKDRLARDAVSIPSVNSDGCAKEVAETVRNSGRGKVIELGSETQSPVANLIVPLRGRVVVPCAAVVGIRRKATDGAR
jgi:hypothetical protein